MTVPADVRALEIAATARMIGSDIAGLPPSAAVDRMARALDRIERGAREIADDLAPGLAAPRQSVGRGTAAVVDLADFRRLRDCA